MKKIVMRSVRAALQLVPKNLKSKLKRSERLTNFYISAVRRSGLFFDAPTPKQTHNLYQAWLLENNTAFNESCDTQGRWQAVVVGHRDGCVKTQDAVLSLGAKTCIYLDSTCDTLELQRTDFDKNLPVLLLNDGDIPRYGAISHFLEALKNADIVYSDTDELAADGTCFAPRFLPSWNPELQLSSGYVRTGIMLRGSMLERLESIDSIASLIVQFELTRQNLKITHIALPLVHATFDDKKNEKDLLLIRQAIESTTRAKVACNNANAINRILWPNTSPLVSLIIPTKNGKKLVQDCIESIIEKTTYSNYEIVLIDNGSDEQESLDYFEHLNAIPKVRVVEYPAEFNYSAINNFGVKHAKGSVIGLINNDIEVITPEWLTYMVGHVERETVGCVGAKLLYSDTRIQHAGVVLGYGGGAGHAHKNFPSHHGGYLNRITATNNFSAVTAACLLVKRSHFEKVGGLNEEKLSVAFNDVDFCLKVKALGVNNVYCAEAELFHHESVSRGLDISPEKAARFNRELAFLQTTWSHIIDNDPCYSPNLTLKRENFSVKSKEEFSEHVK